MRSRLVIGGTLLLISAGIATIAFWLLSSPDGSGTGPLEVDLSKSRPEVRAAKLPRSEEPPAPEEAEAGSAGGQPEAAAEDSEEDPTSTPAAVRGRCIAKESGLPLAGCTVKFSGRPSNSQKMALHGPVDWEDPEPVVTGADGFFEIEFEAMPPYQHHLNIEAEGRVPRTGRWRAFEPGQVEDLGDIEMSLGVTVQGRVFDMQGQPVEKIGVSLKNLPLPIRNGMAANDSRSGWTDDQGRFTVRVPIPVGTWSLDASGRGFRHVSPDSLTIEEGESVVDLEVVVERLESISGIIVDENGQPLEDRISLRTKGFAGVTRTREDSTFVIYGSGDPVQFKCEHPVRYEPLEDERLFEWGSTNVRLTMRRALSFELTVVDAETGTPVEDYAVQCFAKRARWSSNRDARLGGHHPGGKVTVDGVWRGECVLRVIPKDPVYWISEPIEFEAADPGIPPMTVRLERLVPVVVRVVTTDGKPVPGTHIELVHTHGSSIDVAQHVQGGARRVDPFFDRGNNEQRPVTMSEGRTDEQGRVTLARRPDVDVFSVRALGPGHLPAVFNGQLAPPAGTPLEVVVVSQGAGLKGRLTGEAFREYPAGCSLGLRAVDGASSIGDSIPIGADGTFEALNLPPGAFEIVLHTSIRFEMNGGASTGGVELFPALGQVLLEEGRLTEVELDTTPLRPASLRGQVLLDGAHPTAARVSLQGRAGNSSFSCGQYLPDPNGSFLAEGLPPGRYRASLTVTSSERSETLQYQDDEEIVLEPGVRAEHTFRFEHRVLHIRLLEQDGETPLAETKCSSPTENYWREHTSDAAGWLKIEPAPPFPIEIQIRGQRFGPFEVPSGKVEASFEVRVAPAEEGDGH